MPATASSQAEKRARRRAAGFCTECDTPRVSGHSMCQRHQEMHRRRMEGYNQQRRSAGLCYCGDPVQRGRYRCAGCLRAATVKGGAKYAARRAAGNCIQCGRKARKGLARCTRCAAITAGYYQKARRRRIYREARKGQLAARLMDLHPYSIATPKIWG